MLRSLLRLCTLFIAAHILLIVGMVSVGQAIESGEWDEITFVEVVDGLRKIMLRDRRTLATYIIPRAKTVDVLFYDHSADGRFLAYKLDAHLSSQETTPMHIEVVDATSQRHIVTVTEDLIFLNYRDRPTWSADNQQLVFTSRLLIREKAKDPLENIIDNAPMVISNARTHVRVYDFKTGVVQTLYETDISICNAQLSPDLHTLAYQTGCTIARTEIFLLDLETGELRKVAEDSDFWSGYGWSVDGTQFAYTVIFRPHAEGVYIADGDGRNAERLTTSGRFIAWGSDGQSLTYIDSSVVYVFDLETRQTRPLLRLSAQSSEVTFRPRRAG